jgi:hypothetical protein
MGTDQDFLVSWVFLPFSSPNDIVASCVQLAAGSAPNAGVE